MPESVPSSLIIDAFKEIFQAERRGGARQDPLGWIISVPDTHQKSVLAALDKERSLRVITCSTEDDANAVAAGLYMTGLLSREKDRDPKDSRHSMVRFAEPLLDVFGIPHARMEGPDDVKLIPEYYRKSRERNGPAAVLVGLETA
jgi:sulfopyruvate decarboxylase TPP-binding subunit